MTPATAASEVRREIVTVLVEHNCAESAAEWDWTVGNFVGVTEIKVLGKVDAPNVPELPLVRAFDEIHFSDVIEDASGKVLIYLPINRDDNSPWCEPSPKINRYDWLSHQHVLFPAKFLYRHKDA